jgi:hypothetical protein
MKVTKYGTPAGLLVFPALGTTLSEFEACAFQSDMLQGQHFTW